MAIKKQFLKSKPECKVTFTAPSSLVGDSKNIAVAGEFNDWQAMKLKKQKTGDYSASLNLETGKNYQYKYVIDEQRWENDPEADGYAPNEFEGENSILSLQ